MAWFNLTEFPGFSASTAEVSAKIGVPIKNLQYWVASGFITPSIQAGAGTGTPWRWSAQDMGAITAARMLSRAGISFDLLKPIVEKIQQAPADLAGNVVLQHTLTIGEVRWAAMETLKDGATVYRPLDDDFKPTGAADAGQWWGTLPTYFSQVRTWCHQILVEREEKNGAKATRSARGGPHTAQAEPHGREHDPPRRTASTADRTGV